MGSATTRVVLIGFSGTGKTTVGRLLASRRGWTPLDTDAMIEARFGRTVPEIFARDGEAAFRAAEQAALGQALLAERAVIATGGGAVCDSAAWSADLLGRPGTLVVALDARPATALHRLQAQAAAEGAAVARPMLAGGDPLTRIAALKASRQAMYDRAAITLVADASNPADLAAELDALLADPAASEPDIRLSAPSGASAIYVRPGIARRLGTLARERWPKARRAWIVTDAVVGPLHAEAAGDTLGTAGFDVQHHTVPQGEGSKSLSIASELYDWLLDGGVERGDVVVALGGGMIGDLAGFVAATCLRGVGMIQVPTSLLATVDSSVGGKTGINHRAGKNLIGAFAQPPLVVIDPNFLHTLPPRELTSGWAEIVKHAVIQPTTPRGERADLVAFLERNATALHALSEPATSYLIRRNVALKAAVVEADEREAGLRQILNFGHTLGHAVEAADYRYLHGEAIAVGMRAEARLGAGVGTCDAADVARLDALLNRFGLPQSATADPARVLSLISSDKKRTAGRQHWVLPLTGGGVCIRDDVPPAAVETALQAVVRA